MKNLKKLCVVNELEGGKIPYNVLKYANVLGYPLFISPAIVNELTYSISEISTMMFKPDNLIVGRFENPEMAFATISTINSKVTENLVTIMSLSQLEGYEFIIMGNPNTFINARDISGWTMPTYNLDLNHVNNLVNSGMSIFLEPVVFDDAISSGINNQYMADVIAYRGIVTKDANKIIYAIIDKDLKIYKSSIDIVEDANQIGADSSTIKIDRSITNVNEIIRGYRGGVPKDYGICLRLLDGRIDISVWDTSHKSANDYTVDEFIKVLTSNNNNAFLINPLDLRLFDDIIKYLKAHGVQYTFCNIHIDTIQNS